MGTIFNTMEVFHGSFFSWQEQYILFILWGENVLSNAKHFYCPCHAKSLFVAMLIALVVALCCVKNLWNSADAAKAKPAN